MMTDKYDVSRAADEIITKLLDNAPTLGGVTMGEPAKQYLAAMIEGALKSAHRAGALTGIQYTHERGEKIAGMSLDEYADYIDDTLRGKP
jgi:hypothetical protein